MNDQERYRWIADHVLPHEREIRDWIRCCVRDLTSQDIDDVVQAAYAQVWRAGIPEIANGRSYFFKAVCTLIEARTSGGINAIEVPRNFESVGACRSVDGAAWRPDFARLRLAIDGLPVDDRRAFELHKLKGLPLRAVAKEMQLPRKTVEGHLAKALAQILAEMTDVRSSSTTNCTESPHSRKSAQQRRT